MYDFNKFIEIVSSDDSMTNRVKKALDSVKDVFHIGKIEAKSNLFSDNLEYSFNGEYEEVPFLRYNANGYDYNFYRNKDNYSYTEDDKKDIIMLLKLLSIYHENFKLIKKAEEAEYISANTKLPNAQGYIKEVKSLAEYKDITQYNAYFINIKGFALVNKLFGSKQGDAAIRSYANRLYKFVGDDEIVGHLGGDNFTALIKRENHQNFIDLVTMCPVEIEKDGVKTKVNLIGVVGYEEIDDKNLDLGSIVSNSSMACQYARNNKRIERNK